MKQSLPQPRVVALIAVIAVSLLSVGCADHEHVLKPGAADAFRKKAGAGKMGALAAANPAKGAAPSPTAPADPAH